MGQRTRMTGPTTAVLATFLSEPTTSRYGLELGALLGLPSGTIHPILARLEGLGWLTSGWELIDPQSAGRPARRYYRLTPLGAADGREALTRAQANRARLLTRLTATEGLT